MEARYLRAKLRMLGFRLRVAGDELHIAPDGALTSDLRDSIQQHRAALIADVLAHPDPPLRCLDCGAALPAPLKWRCPDCLAARDIPHGG